MSVFDSFLGLALKVLVLRRLICVWILQQELLFLILSKFNQIILLLLSLISFGFLISEGIEVN